MTGSRRFPVFPVAIISAMVLVAIFAAPLAPYSPYETSLPDKLKPPFWVSGGSTEHLLGTDLVGRDVLSRMIYGARVSLLVAAVGVLLAGAVGTAVALVAGYLGGRVDALIMRIVDIMLAFPVIILALILAVVLGPSLANLIYIICIILWVRYARVLRGDVLQYKQREFVTYARVAGTSTLKIMTHHLLPNIANTLMVLLTFEAGAVILLEAGLSFLGVGVPPPTPTWGRMIAEGRDYIVSAWWLVTFPGVAISLVVLSLNLFGDWLRDYIDPKLRQM
ncbi:MAG: ABC transporter permease [Chloroflexi bacterium]|nr:ABC transporter permease [Chloroflexota bacterium]